MGNTKQSYQIYVKGHLCERWHTCFDGIHIACCPDGNSRLSGDLDQSALHGVLNRIQDLGLELISVHLQSTTEDEPSSETQF